MNFKNFIKELQDTRLSETEKDSLRYKISEFISMSPIRGTIPEIGRVRYISVFAVKHFAKATALVLIFAIVIGGTGVSYAASNALPGDALYTVKINVNEGIEGALATTAKQKLTVESKKVERRLEEAQILVKENKLTAANKKIVEAKLDEHLGNISKQIEEVKKDGDVELALETTANLTPVLVTHKHILEDAKTEDTDATTEEGEETATLIAKVDDSITKVQNEETSIIASLAGTEESPEAVATMSVMMTSVSNETDPSLAKTEDTTTVDEQIGLSDEELALRKEEKEKEIAKKQIEKIENNLSDLVQSRIKSAQTKIVLIKKEIAFDESLEVKSDTMLKEATLVENIETTITGDVTLPVTTQFNASQKVKEADALISEAKDLFEKGHYKEALEIAQEVNRIATEIETQRKLKALELAKASIEATTTLKASVQEALPLIQK